MTALKRTTHRLLEHTFRLSINYQLQITRKIPLSWPPASEVFQISYLSTALLVLPAFLQLLSHSSACLFPLSGFQAFSLYVAAVSQSPLQYSPIRFLQQKAWAVGDQGAWGAMVADLINLGHKGSEASTQSWQWARDLLLPLAAHLFLRSLWVHESKKFLRTGERKA